MNKFTGDRPERANSRRPQNARRVYGRILERIIRGSLPPGERVVERALAESLDVSRTPVREAILRLQQEGFLVPAPTAQKVHLIVSPLRGEAALQLSQLVGVLEGLAVRSAATAPPKERSTLVAQLTKDLNEFRKHLETGKASFHTLFQIDERFHARFTDDYADDHLYGMLTVVRPHVARYTWAYVASQEVPWRMYRDEHTSIIEGIRSGNPDAAEASVRANWNGVGVRFHSAASRVANSRRYSSGR